MIDGIIQGVLANSLSKVLSATFAHPYLLGLRIYKPNDEIRIAFSAIIRICYQGKYVLVRNLHRPETFCPFGGVFKYYEDAIPFLNSIDFRQHIVDVGKDMDYDIRGFLPRKNLVKLLDWYNRKIERESYGECLLRELQEEMIESSCNVVMPGKIKFRFVRKIIEKPKYLEPINCYQYRIFEVYDIYPIDKHTEKFIKKFYSLAKTNHNLLVVSSDEIKRGRSIIGAVIGPHSHYLINHRRYRGDDPMFVNQNGKSSKKLN